MVIFITVKKLMVKKEKKEDEITGSEATKLP